MAFKYGIFSENNKLGAFTGRPPEILWLLQNLSLQMDLQPLGLALCDTMCTIAAREKYIYFYFKLVHPKPCSQRHLSGKFAFLCVQLELFSSLHFIWKKAQKNKLCSKYILLGVLQNFKKES